MRFEGSVIRRCVIGRRNWLFADTSDGAETSANLHSIFETAKINGHEPCGYLRHLFTELTKASSPEHITAHLPFNVPRRNIPDP